MRLFRGIRDSVNSICTKTLKNIRLSVAMNFVIVGLMQGCRFGLGFGDILGLIRFIWITFFWIPLGLGVFFGLFWYFFGLFWYFFGIFFGLFCDFLVLNRIFGITR
jgi:hypothetical protein